MIASALTAVLGQRLVRVLCPKCKVRTSPTPSCSRRPTCRPTRSSTSTGRPSPEEQRRTPNGEPQVCEHCGGTGYLGRTGIFELLVITDTIRDLIRENPNLNAIKAEAVKNGMIYLQEDGLRQVIEGKTSIQELLRVGK